MARSDARQAELAKQDRYREADRLTKKARKLDAAGQSDKADDARQAAADMAQWAVRMETCPQIPR